MEVSKAREWWSVLQRMKAMIFPDRSESFIPSTRV